MRLTKVSDYSLRVLIYLAVHTARPISIGEMSRAYGVSPHVLVKVVQLLVEDGSVASVRGRHGGFRLGRAPGEINVGALVRRTESTWDVVECFNRDTNTCPIEPACGLKGALKRAQRAFLAVLDDCTVADLLPRPGEVGQLLRVSLERRHGASASGDRSRLKRLT
jgi:Rrf2 family transcriptional regulator, nitric oxide-sensitive transcriptional repressor